MKSIYKYLPYEEFNIHTNYDPEYVCAQLKILIEINPSKKKQSLWTGESDTTKQYGGFVLDNRFEAERLNVGRNAWRPLISGSIKSSGETTIVSVKQAIMSQVLFFSLIWLIGGLFGAIMIIYHEALSGNYCIPLLSLLFPFGGYLLFLLAFKHESMNFRNDLKRLLEKEY